MSHETLALICTLLEDSSFLENTYLERQAAKYIFSYEPEKRTKPGDWLNRESTSQLRRDRTMSRLAHQGTVTTAELRVNLPVMG